MRSSHVSIMVAALFLSMAAAASGGDGQSPATLSGYRLRNWVVGCAGAPASDAGFHVEGTLAQPTPTGVAAGPPGLVYAGFWWEPGWQASVPETGSDAAIAYGLHQNRPNPFSRSTAICFSLARKDNVVLTIYDVTGRRVKCLAEGVMPAGTHSTAWDGRDMTGTRVSPGVYFYQLRAGSFETVRKMLVIH